MIVVQKVQMKATFDGPRLLADKVWALLPALATSLPRVLVLASSPSSANVKQRPDGRCLGAHLRLIVNEEVSCIIFVEMLRTKEPS